MAAEEKAVAADMGEQPQDQRDEILKKVNRLLKTIGTAVGELTECVAALSDETQRKTGGKDEYGEPNWKYAVKVGVPKDIYLTRKFLEYGEKFGFNASSMAILMHGVGTYEGFIKYYQRQAGQKNGKWANWSLVFMKWVRTEHERKQKKAAGVASATRFDRQRTRG